MTALVISEACLPRIRHLLLCGPTILLIGTTVIVGQDIIRWQDAANYYGQVKTVEGTIIETKNTGKVCFLNFSPNWRTDFTAAIFASDFSKFPPNPESYYMGKKVRVTGNIQEYRGKRRNHSEEPKPDCRLGERKVSRFRLSTTSGGSTGIRRTSAPRRRLLRVTRPST